jgi:hypothetical protein
MSFLFVGIEFIVIEKLAENPRTQNRTILIQFCWQ